MKCVLRIVMLAALAMSACRRPAPEDSWSWEKDPGLDPHPAGQTLEGPSGPKLPDVSFRIDPARGTTETTAAAQPASEEEALYLRAARSGQAWAQTKIGIKYVQEGDDIARLGEGLRWLNAAADQNDTEALRALSALAAQGRGMDQSDKEAYKYMSRAAELGSPEAQYELAMMLANGRGMPRDMEAALIWARQASAKGSPDAQYFTGIALLRRAASPEDVREGLAQLEQACAQDHRQALMVLAGILTRGEFGQSKDVTRAESLLLSRAQKGDPEFQFGLATLYLYGGQFQDGESRAAELLRQSSEAGFEKSTELLAKIRGEEQKSAQ